MDHRLNSKVISEYHNPYSALDKPTLKVLRKAYFKELAIRVGICVSFLVFLIVLRQLGGVPTSRRYINAVPTATFVISMYLLYGLLTTKQGIIRLRRSQLVKQYPALQPIDQKINSNKVITRTSGLVKGMWIALAVTILATSIAIAVTN